MGSVGISARVGKKHEIALKGPRSHSKRFESLVAATTLPMPVKCNCMKLNRLQIMLVTA